VVRLLLLLFWSAAPPISGERWSFTGFVSALRAFDVSKVRPELCASTALRRPCVCQQPSQQPDDLQHAGFSGTKLCACQACLLRDSAFIQSWKIRHQPVVACSNVAGYMPTWHMLAAMQQGSATATKPTLHTPTCSCCSWCSCWCSTAAAGP
jgi:hypothetical protein